MRTRDVNMLWRKGQWAEGSPVLLYQGCDLDLQPSLFLHLPLGFLNFHGQLFD